MHWLRWQLAQHKAALFIAALIGTVLVVAVLFPPRYDGASRGFGPDWECTAQGQGGPTCIKKIKP
jgi:hypothetical protein